MKRPNSVTRDSTHKLFRCKNCPEWAIDLSKAICDSHNRNYPSLVFRKTSDVWGNSRWFNFTGSDIILVTASVETYARAILIHELTHHILNSGRHGEAFYLKVEELYSLYNVSPKMAIEIEQIYPDHWIEGFKTFGT